jgi:DNA polymerase-3 subunit delta'
MPFTADEAFDLLQRSRARGRFSQAYLLSGAAGSGKKVLLARLAGLLLECKGDAPAKHPDYHAIEPQMKTRVIGIEAMQELLGHLHMRPLRGGAKIAVVHDADRMNVSASNALLRTLEEPPGHTHFFLLTTQPEQLLETILSRCIEVPLRSLERQPLSQQQKALLEALSTAPTQGDLAAVFGLARRFAALLTEAREQISEETEAAFKKEETVLKQVGAKKDAIEEREDFYKALTESRYRAERDGMIAVAEQWFADALRHQHGAPAVDHTDYYDVTASLATAHSTAELLRRSAALAELRENFGRTVQEQLAVECAFLKAFGAVPGSVSK